MGARDATRGEIETNFSDKVWFNWDTTHIIKPPEALKQYMGLTSRTCVAAPVRMEDKDVELLRNQVPGFKLATAREGGLTCIRQEWKAKDAGSAASLSAAVSALAKELGHPAAVYVSGADVAVELTTPSVGGLSENDFVVACKINAMNVKDFLAKKKPKYWA